jgi:hypothetical protein
MSSAIALTIARYRGPGNGFKSGLHIVIIKFDLT